MFGAPFPPQIQERAVHGSQARPCLPKAYAVFSLEYMRCRHTSFFLSDAEESGKNLREGYLHEYGQARVFFLQIGFRVQECVGADPA